MKNVSRDGSESRWTSCQKITNKSTMKYIKKKNGKLTSAIITRLIIQDLQRADKMIYQFAQKSRTRLRVALLMTDNSKK